MDDFAEKLGSLSVAELEAQVRHHNKLYWDQAKPEISDYDYDRLVNRLRALAPDSPVLSAMGESAPAPDAATAVKHKRPMLSLDKCYSHEELQKWAQTFDGLAVMSPKFDGIACSLHYDGKGELALAATRGDGVVGENITQNTRAIADVPKKLAGARNVEVRGEIFMRLSVFKAFKDQGFANPRNLAAGAIKQKSVEKSAAYKLSFAAYDLLGTEHATEAEKMAFLAEAGFPPVERQVLAKDALAKGYEDLAARRSTLDFEIDGVVFKADRVAEQQRLGSNSHHPRYAIAYKFQGESGKSFVRDLEWSVARTGAITPVAIIDPVELSGATVVRASLHHTGYIAKLGLTKNAEVVLVRRGGVIPNVEFVSAPGDAPLPLPTKCPSCGGPVKLEKDFLYCVAPQNCRDAVIGRLAHYATAVGMLGFGDAVLAGGFDKGFLKRPADFYSLTEAQLLQLDRMGTKVAKKLLAEVDKARTLELAVFLRAFGLAELGKHVSAILAKTFGTLDRVLAVTADELGAIKSIGDVIAKTVVDGLASNRDEIASVRAHVTLTNTATAEADGAAGASKGAAVGPFTGKTFVFTGKMATLDRKAAEALVAQLGGAALDSVQKTLTYLVVGDQKTDEKSSKQKAAEKHKSAGAPIEVISETAFLGLVEQARSQPAPAPATTSPASASSASSAPSAPASTREQPSVAAASAPSAAGGDAPEKRAASATPAHEAPKEPRAGARPALSTETWSPGALAGAVVAFAAKLRDASPEAAKARVEALGGRVVDEWSDAVTMLVVGARGRPGEWLAKARANGAVLVLEEPEFLARAALGQPALFG